MDFKDAHAFSNYFQNQNAAVISAKEFEKRGMKANRDMMIPIRGIEHPSFKTYLAIQDKLTERILFSTWGGIGDQICIEPTLRWATTNGLLDPARPGWRPHMTLASDYPELYSHLEFDDVYDTKMEQPIVEDYLEFRPAVDQDALTDLFINHMTTVCTDYPALVAFRKQLYVSERNVILKPKAPDKKEILEIAEDVKRGAKYVAFHCGKHWESKTFGVEYWNAELEDHKRRGFTPILIGAAQTKHGGGYVDVDRRGCVDFLDKTTIMESVWLLQNLPLLVCSDSAPLHMAVSGNAFIAFIATAKHTDFITHWRKNLQSVNEWSWRMKNFSKGGKWLEYSNLPTSNEPISVEKCDPETLKKWLPELGEIGQWCEEKFNEYRQSI